MKYLLNTRVSLWTVFAPDNVSSKVRKVIEDHDNLIYVITVTYWEISLKYGLGRLISTNVLPDALQDLAQQMDFKIMNVGEHMASTSTNFQGIYTKILSTDSWCGRLLSRRHSHYQRQQAEFL